ncbi:hypothetical protein BDN70DRAFT_882602 [Pholiota conissans]|uniref:Uncharacterized protein n=1 Tax=Pholiota conissans TaxID=109636 RepID=A0A9P5YYJ2_9AGAR|nr:hypothetical protein BDN70DRAFT_882602 [Pholiota conissans]
MFSTLFTFVPLVLAVVGVTADASRLRVVHNGVAKRMHGDLAKRVSGARWTFYDVGLGACGQTNVASDFIVALNSNEFGSGYPGPHCFKQIQMTYNGKTAVATIMDECPGCPTGGLDLSRGLFTHFDSEDKGVIYGEWSFVGDSAAATTTSKALYVAPTTTTKALYVAPTTTTEAQVQHTTTSTKAHVASTTPHTTTKARVVTSTKKAPVTSSSTVHPAAAQTTTAIASGNNTASTTTLSASSSTAANSTSTTADLSSTFTAVAAASTGINATADGTNTTAQIEANMKDINTLLTKLGELIMSAVLAKEN